MAQCRYCGNKGLFLKVSKNGMCQNCDETQVTVIEDIGKNIIQLKYSIAETKNLYERKQIIAKLYIELEKMIAYELKGIPTIEPLASELKNDLKELEIKLLNLSDNNFKLEAKPRLTKNILELNNTLYCDDLIELKGEFIYDNVKSVYKRKNDIIYKSEPNWVQFEYIEMEFNQEFTSGYYREYYRSGKLRKEVPFVKSDSSNDFYVQGILKLYYEDKNSNGDYTYTILQEDTYENRERVGVWKTYSIDGGLLSETFYDDVLYLGDGFARMKIKEYHNYSGVLARVNEKNGGKSFYENQKLKAEWTNKDFREDGLYVEYYEDGSRKMEVNYKDGIRFGIMNKYYLDGKLKEKWSYTPEGKRIFVNKYFDNNKLKSEWIYKDGELVNKIEYDKEGNVKMK